MASPPVALGLTLCDYVIIEEKTKKASLVGCFSSLKAAQFPALAQPFSAWAVLVDGLGDVTMNLIVTRLDTEEEIQVLENRVHFPDRLTEVRYHVRFRQFIFPAPAIYQFTLLADKEWVAQYRIRVYAAEESS